eukprot:gene2727-1749_t
MGWQKDLKEAGLKEDSKVTVMMRADRGGAAGSRPRAAPGAPPHTADASAATELRRCESPTNTAP